MSSLPLTGQCHCGATQYELSKPPAMVYNCHCTNCQKISGSAFGISAAIAADSFRITSGDPARVEWPSDVGTQRYGIFCNTCGSRIAHGMNPETAVMSLRAGTLHDTSWLKPVADIWTDSAQPWVHLSEDRLQYPRQPEDYGPLLKAFAAQGNF